MSKVELIIFVLAMIGVAGAIDFIFILFEFLI